ncbi:TnsD family Tn7-like transposition protein [Craterilacuibacter sp. RT1T]|uniref:TnsD family Tn7-like transposition protein n=1 Tax=Craterilacuibacter sp. RT1T TaxID=2942211 RepID=UPI0020BF1E24|nr:TnsD family transposase [Craterilacuibacter sp. RT1T]
MSSKRVTHSLSEKVKPAAFDAEACLALPYLTDETIISMVSRYHVQSGNPTVDRTLNVLFGTQMITLNHWIPRHLDRLAEYMPGSTNLLLEGLLKNNTLFPLVNLFLGRMEESAYLMQQSLPKRAFSGAGAVRICLPCLREDEQTHGTPYIHLSHQTPGVYVCTKHQVWLTERCPYCRQPLSRDGSLPLGLWRECVCGHSLSSFDAEPASSWQNVELSYASFCADLLGSRAFPVPADVLREMYRSRAIEVCGGHRNGALDRLEFQRMIHEYYGPLFLAKLDMDYSLGNFTKSYHWLSTSTVKEVPLIRHLVLSNFLFRSAQDFNEARTVAEVRCVEQRRKEDESQQPPDKSVKLFEDMLSAAREIPKCTLEKLWEQHFGLTKRFIKRFPDRLDELLLAARKKSPAAAKPLQRRALTKHEDHEWADRFRETAFSLYQLVDERPVRVSRNRIMGEAGWKRPYPNVETSPSAWRALEESLESDWHYHARRYVWASIYLRPEQGTSRITKASGLDNLRIKELRLFFSAVTHWPLLKPGILMEFLESFGITRQWVGPCPDKQFPLLGRKYQRKLREPGLASE